MGVLHKAVEENKTDFALKFEMLLKMHGLSVLQKNILTCIFSPFLPATKSMVVFFQDAGNT